MTTSRCLNVSLLLERLVEIKIEIESRLYSINVYDDDRIYPLHQIHIIVLKYYFLF